MYAILAGRFPIWYFFECCTRWIEAYFHLWSFFKSFSLFAYPFGFSVIPSSLSYFSPKLFYFFVIWMLVCLCILFLPVGRIFFVFSECPILSLLFYPVWIFFSLPSFTGIFWFISSNFIVYSTGVAFFFSSQNVPSFFRCLITFAC